MNVHRKNKCYHTTYHSFLLDFLNLLGHRIRIIVVEWFAFISFNWWHFLISSRGYSRFIGIKFGSSIYLPSQVLNMCVNCFLSCHQQFLVIVGELYLIRILLEVKPYLFKCEFFIMLVLHDWGIGKRWGIKESYSALLCWSCLVFAR